MPDVGRNIALNSDRMIEVLGDDALVRALYPGIDDAPVLTALQWGVILCEAPPERANLFFFEVHARDVPDDVMGRVFVYQWDKTDSCSSFQLRAPIDPSRKRPVE